MTLVDLGVELGLLVSLAFFYYRWYWIIEILWWYIATFFSMQVPANHSLALSGGWPRMLEMVVVYKSWAILAYNHLESKQSPMVLYMPRGFIFIKHGFLFYQIVGHKPCSYSIINSINHTIILDSKWNNSGFRRFLLGKDLHLVLGYKVTNMIPHKLSRCILSYGWNIKIKHGPNRIYIFFSQLVRVVSESKIIFILYRAVFVTHILITYFTT